MIRLYGHEAGEGSFTQVTRGISRALTHHNVLAGFVPIDRALGEYDSFAGSDAAISLNAGAPFVLHAAVVGQHKQRWLMLAPNSEHLAPSFVKRLLDEHEGIGRVYHGLLSPSAWGAEVLRRHVDLPVVVAPHGISPEVHQPKEHLRQLVHVHYELEEFRVIHMTSGRTARKGTRELIKAWAYAKQQRRIPELATLLVLIEPHFTDVEFWAREEGLSVDTDGKLKNPDMAIRTGFGLKPEGVVELYSYVHLLAQPSRGEGFGICPLEALACGVPVLMTDCTGHSEYAWSDRGDTLTGGRAIVPTGTTAALDDFDNSVAPSLAWQDVYEALAKAYSSWPALDTDAMACSTAIRKTWPWERVVEPAIKELMKGV